MFWNKKIVFCIFKLGIFKFQYVAKYRTLAREVAHSIREPREVSDVDVIHEHHTGDCWLNTCLYHVSLQVHFINWTMAIYFCIELFLCPSLPENNYRVTMIFWDQGIVAEKSSINVGPAMASPPTRNLYVHPVSEATIHKVGALSMFCLYFAAPFPVILVV